MMIHNESQFFKQKIMLIHRKMLKYVYIVRFVILTIQTSGFVSNVSVQRDIGH